MLFFLPAVHTKERGRSGDVRDCRLRKTHRQNDKDKRKWSLTCLFLHALDTNESFIYSLNTYGHLPPLLLFVRPVNEVSYYFKSSFSFSTATKNDELSSSPSFLLLLLLLRVFLSFLVLVNAVKNKEKGRGGKKASVSVGKSLKGFENCC